MTAPRNLQLFPSAPACASEHLYSRLWHQIFHLSVGAAPADLLIAELYDDILTALDALVVSAHTGTACETEALLLRLSSSLSSALFIVDSAARIQLWTVIQDLESA